MGPVFDGTGGLHSRCWENGKTNSRDSHLIPLTSEFSICQVHTTTVVHIWEHTDSSSLPRESTHVRFT